MYSNSQLVDYVKISPNKHVGRGGRAIDTITIHHVVGQASVETLGAHFSSPAVQASSNYGVGFDGRIGMYVEEKDRSWCSSSGSNDRRAVTIEVANDRFPPYAVTEKVYFALIDLVADICIRNGIRKLVWSTSKSDRLNRVNGCNMTVHRDFAATACPGTFLYERMGDIAAKVNAKLDVFYGTPETPATPSTPEPEPQPEQKPEPQSSSNICMVGLPVLRKGDHNDHVHTMQTQLEKRGYNLGRYGTDRKFGGYTDRALRLFQARNGLSADGVCGLATWTKLLGSGR